MQILNKNGRVVTKEYHHMMTMNEDVHWRKLAHLLLIFPLNLRAPSVNLPLLQILNSLLKCTN